MRVEIILQVIGETLKTCVDFTWKSTNRHKKLTDKGNLNVEKKVLTGEEQRATIKYVVASGNREIKDFEIRVFRQFISVIDNVTS